MSDIVVSFRDYVPSPRSDGAPWTEVAIQESTAQDGPWSQIDQQPILPLDADPANPAARTFTTSNATLMEGWYRLLFLDALGNQSFTDPTQNIIPSDIEWRPTIGQVGRKIMSRTRDQFGKLSGTFTPLSEPTDTQVVQIIDDVSTSVADAIGDDIPDFLHDDAANVLAIKAAMQIELDFYADQVNTGRSVYPQLKEQYKEELAALQRQITLVDEGGDARVTDSGPSLAPSFGFPPSTGWLTRRM